MEEKRRELVRSVLESMGIVIPDEVREKFEGKQIRVVPDEEWNKIVGEKLTSTDSKTDSVDEKSTE